MATNTHKIRVPVEVAGSVTVSGDPTLDLQLATKQYVDKIRPIAQGGTNASGFVSNTVVKFDGTRLVADATTTDLAEGTNLYYTDTRVDNRIENVDQDVTSQWTFNTKLPTSTVTPTQSSELVTKNYVDNKISGMAWQEPVGRTGAAGVGSSLPAVTGWTNGERFIVNTAPAKLYTLVSGAWNAGVAPGDNWAVFDKSTEAGYVYDKETTLFVQFSGAGQITAGAGMTKSGNTLDVVGTTKRIVVSADSINLDTTAWPQPTGGNKAFYTNAADTGVWGILPVSAGGTGSSGAITNGGIAYGSSSGIVTTAAGTSGQALLSGATGTPTWGTLGTAAGGTGTTTAPTQYGVIIGATGTSYGSTAAGTTGQILMAATGAAPSFQTPPTATDSAAGYMSAADHQILVASQLFEANFTLADNITTATTIAGLTFAYADYAAEEISYVIRRGAGRSRSGTIYITTDVNGDFSYSDNGTELGNCGINITVEKVGTSIEVKYTSDNIGTAGQMRMKVKKLAVPT